MEFLDQVLRVTISDERKIKGYLKCVDNAMNLILGDSVSEIVENVAKHEHLLGTVMIPQEHIKKIEILQQ
eukprot:snap_masked-scaffold_11-processed-gene-2.8-mRNA-1 protein AED:1.00 eAED:1.00 QI:0/-1/0/0/-1/1/1/0/69